MCRGCSLSRALVPTPRPLSNSCAAWSARKRKNNELPIYGSDWPRIRTVPFMLALGEVNKCHHCGHSTGLPSVPRALIGNALPHYRQTLQAQARIFANMTRLWQPQSRSEFSSEAVTLTPRSCGWTARVPSTSSSGGWRHTPPGKAIHHHLYMAVVKNLFELANGVVTRLPSGADR